MKKRIIELQLFADDAATAASASTAASAASSATAVTEPGNTTTEKEPATAAKQEKQGEPKYTDADVNKLIDQKFAEWQKKQQKAVDEAQKLAEMNAQEKAGIFPKELPMFFVAGDEDPVGANGKGVEMVCQRYKDKGAKNVSMKLYAGDRHEILNELDKAVVYEDLLNWILN